MEDNIGSVNLKDEAIKFLKNLISKNLKIPLELIDDDYLLDEYGLDSMAIISLIRKMEDTFGVLPKTLFYEYATIEELAEFFVKKHSKKLREMAAEHGVKAKSKKDLDKNLKTSNENVGQANSLSSIRSSRFIKDKNITDGSKDKETIIDLVESEETNNADIAIIGLSGRYPMARNLTEFWNNLKEGKDCITEIPKERWNYKLYYDSDKNKRGKSYMKDGGFIDGAYEFDPLFFSISPRDAKYIDPQERLFLECVYEVIEDAGYTKKGLKRLNSSGMSGNVGVYLGVMWEDYQLYGAQEQILGNPIFMTGSQSSIANRVSYYFDLHGPSMAIDSMCSSSMTSIHLACQSLYLGECDAAIAGGVNLSLHPNKYLLLSENKFASSRGRCESFGDKGDGYVPGEGVGAVLLKPLSKAIEDGDHIYGVIKGTGVNHGGNTSGYSVPNPNAQASVIESALKKAGIDPRTISYVEAHGTGTSLGDPIEIAGLTKTYEKYTEDKQFCMIGSVKSNIGHLEGAAGIAGLTKVLLQMKYKQIIPSIHSSVLNPYIDFENSPFCVSRSNSKWDRPEIEQQGVLKEYPRRSGISAFGAGGSNSHMIVEEYIPKQNYALSENDKPYAVILSAKSREQLEEQVKRLYEKVKENYMSDSYIPSIAYTLDTGREMFDYRLGMLVSTTAELINQLSAFLHGNTNVEDGIWFGHVKRGSAKINKTTDGKIGSRVDLLIAQRNMEELLSIWIKGSDFDWNQLYVKSKPQRISLPTYPFLRDVYYGVERMMPYLFGKENGLNETPYNIVAHEPTVSIKTAVETETDKVAGSVDNDGTELMIFRELWNEKEEKLEDLSEKVVVCFAMNLELRQTVNSEMQILGARITLVWVSCGERYQKNSSQDYQIAYEQKEDYELCLKEIKKDFKSIQNIIYLNPLSDKIFLSESSGIIYILQGIHRAKITGVGMIIAGSYENGIERAYAESWIGIEKSIKLAMLEVYVKVVLGDKNEFAYGSFISILLKELYSEEKCSVLYEDAKRKVLEITPVVLNGAKSTTIKEGGTYLITGGFGGLGVMFAKWLGSKYHASIVLTGRRNADSLQDKVKQLTNDGINITYVQADVCNVNQMKYAIETAKKKYGHLDGIIHAAGIENNKNIVDKDIDEYQHVLSPKIQGTLAIDKALIGEDISFICYFSSNSAILGDFGFCDYSVANRFEMGYTKYRNGNSHIAGKAVVINWPLWKDGGMGFSSAAASKMYLKTSGQRFLYEEEGTELFDRLINHGEEEYLVMAGKRNRIYDILKINETNVHKRSDERENLYVMSQTTVHEQGKGWKNIMKGWTIEQSIIWDLKELLYERLSVPKNQMDENINLADFGFDSVSLSDYAKMISEKFEISFTPDLFYSYSTLDELTKYIAVTFSKEIQLFYSEGSAVSPVSVHENKPQKVSEEVKIVTEPVVPKRIQSHYEESIAIVGISGKFSDAQNTEELWNILKEGREVIHEVSKERSEWYEEAQNHYNQKMGSVRGIDEFDPAFFEISPREAENMDPRQRLLLEETWKALEDAGFGYQTFIDEKVGMFVGAEDGDYQLIQAEKSGITSNHNAIMAARISYFLNLNGPNMCMNTSCSSGLVAVHQACQSLRSGECDAAIAAGVNLLITPIAYRGMDNAGMLSKDRRCYAFDKRANGMVPAEAIAVVVLKKLSTAERDNNTIYGVIEGSGINYDGKTNGITAPSGRAQTMLLKEVYEKYAINPAEIDYIVTHGTGTRLGDPIEINALVDAFAESNVRKESIALTSTKSNIGHSLAASGVVSLISLVMAMKHEMIPASINCSQRSDYINWEESPFYINTENRVWKDKEDKRRFGAVDAFGMSGTNVHVVVGSYQSKQSMIKKQYSYYLLALSAKTLEALNNKCNDLINYLEHGSENIDMADISYTLLDGRQHFAYRMAVVAADKASAIGTLKQALVDGKVPNAYQGKINKDFSSQTTIQKMVTSLCHECQRTIDEQETIKDNLNALAEFYCTGYQVKSGEMFAADNVRRVTVPTYPFDNKRYWVRKVEDSKVFEPSKPKVSELVIPEIFQRIKPKEPEFIKSKAPESAVTAITIEKLVTEMTESLATELYLSTSSIDINKSFLELGLDSIIGVEWVNAINKKYGLCVNTTIIYQYPNLVDFATYLISQPEFKQHNYHSKDNLSIQVQPEELMKDIATSLANELYIDVNDIDYEKSFMEMGLDSVVGVEWIRAINRIYDTFISTTIIYQYPTIVEFAKYLYQLIHNTDKETTEGEFAEQSVGVYLNDVASTEEIYAEDTKQVGTFLTSLDSLSVFEYSEADVKPARKTLITLKAFDSIESNHRDLVYDDSEKADKINSKQISAKEIKISFTELAGELGTSLAAELYMDKEDIDYDKSFMEMGLDSIIGVEWIRHVNKKYGTNIPSTKIYQYPTITEFSGYLKEKLTMPDNHMDEKILKQDDFNQLLVQVYQGDIDVELAQKLIYKQSKE